MNNHRDDAGKSPGGKARGTSDDATSEISRKLRSLYDSVQAEPIPDRFLDLLEKLDEVEGRSGEGDPE